jgi:hypothetical protein
MDITSLIRFSEAVEDQYRLGLYKRIADVCLFILGIFPDYAERSYRYPLSGEIRPQITAGAKISPEEYEKKGQQFYRLAAEHRAAAETDLLDVFRVLHENFQKAKKEIEELDAMVNKFIEDNKVQKIISVSDAATTDDNGATIGLTGNGLNLSGIPSSWVQEIAAARTFFETARADYHASV